MGLQDYTKGPAIILQGVDHECRWPGRQLIRLLIGLSVFAGVDCADDIPAPVPPGLVSRCRGEGYGSDVMGSLPLTSDGGYSAGRVGQASSFDRTTSAFTSTAAESSVLLINIID